VFLEPRLHVDGGLVEGHVRELVPCGVDPVPGVLPGLLVLDEQHLRLVGATDAAVERLAEVGFVRKVLRELLHHPGQQGARICPKREDVGWPKHRMLRLTPVILLIISIG